MNYKKIHDDIIERAKARELLEGELHHIIPKCMGGSDNASNIVKLTYSEHYVVHQLLCKLYPKNPKLYLAAHIMSTAPGQYTRNNKSYSWIKAKMSSALSELRKGELNPFYGKTHSEEYKKSVSERLLKHNWIKGVGHSDECKAKMSKIQRSAPHWEKYNELYELWILNNKPKEVSFRKIAVLNGYPDVRYQKMVDKFRGGNG
ncbi:homing endonuclease [Edwardsiella phage PEi20]|uniref:Homing endonuclease n=2 Tax=Kanagawavirus pei20 TaxID=2844109 RepID=A0A0B6VTT1_9CAUD|nr:homing endonuclease [Edwardsiella phage PEi20]BAQ22680.1 homing endonuclease [Edwardsiella phage PEi20]BAQ22981.1 homing endonuclease [Edwardsiella phage PEi26]